MKKVIGIVGSLRKDSLNRVVFNEYKTLCQNSFELMEADIKDLPLYNQDLEGKVEAATNLGSQILNADGVIFFSPEYNYSIPGVLKNALDWVSRDSRKPFDKKFASIIGASPGSVGTARMQYHLRQVGVFLNINFLNRPEVMIGNAFEKIKDGQIQDAKTKDFLKSHVQIFLEHMGK